MRSSMHASVGTRASLSVGADPCEYEMISYSISVYSHPKKRFIPACVVQLTACDIPNKYCIFGQDVTILVFLCHLNLNLFLSQVPEEDIVSVTEMLQAQRKDMSS